MNSYKNKILHDEYTLSDYNVENNSNLVILQGSGYKEEEYKPTDDELKVGYEVIRNIFGENIYFNEEIMKESIIKHRGNSEEAALYLTVPENVKTLEKELDGVGLTTIYRMVDRLLLEGIIKKELNALTLKS